MKYLTFFCLLFLTGCIHTSKDLGGGYTLAYNNNALDKVILIDSPEDGINVTFYTDSSKSEKFMKNEDWIVDSYVDNAIDDDKFILIDQKPMDSICECNQKCLEIKYPNYDKLPTVEMCTNAIKNAKFHRYYIIEKKTNILYGPMSKISFDQMFMKLHVDKDLRLNSNDKKSKRESFAKIIF